jgi:hypothetical protein
MSVSVSWEGLSAFSEGLRNLPEALAGDASAIIRRTTEETKAELLRGYPVGPGYKASTTRGTRTRSAYPGGNLRAGVSSNVARSGVATVGHVFSLAPHAHFWELGTVDRFTKQWRPGSHRGVMPAHRSQSLHAIADRRRATMNMQLADLVRRAGFTVSGNAEE